MSRGVAVLLLCAIPLLGGCLRVRPWDREVLAARELRQPPRALVYKETSHVLAVREGSRGGDGAAGGGCGCN